MSPQRLNAVLFAGQARLPKIGMEARVAAPLSSPLEPPQGVGLRSRVLHKLLLNDLASNEQSNECRKLLADNWGLSSMTEDAFQAFVGEVARSKYKEDLFNAKMLLELREPLKSTHSPPSKITFLATLMSLQGNDGGGHEGIERFMRNQGNPNLSQEAKHAARSDLIRKLYAKIRERHPTIAQALDAISRMSGETDWARMISQLNQIPPRSL